MSDTPRVDGLLDQIASTMDTKRDADFMNLMVKKARQLERELTEQQALTAEVTRKRAAAQKDAERYRWLRRFDHFDQVDEMLNSTCYNTLDAAVDAAMKGE